MLGIGLSGPRVVRSRHRRRRLPLQGQPAAPSLPHSRGDARMMGEIKREKLEGKDTSWLYLHADLFLWIRAGVIAPLGNGSSTESKGGADPAGLRTRTVPGLNDHAAAAAVCPSRGKRRPPFLPLGKGHANKVEATYKGCPVFGATLGKPRKCFQPQRG